jgi:hypothetical protein
MSKRTRVALLLGLPLFVALLAGALYPGQRVGIAVVVIAATLTAGTVALLTWIVWAAHGNAPLAKLLRPYRAGTTRPSDLASLERVLGWKVYTEAEFNHRVRPILRSILRARLTRSYAVDPDSAPDRALASVPNAIKHLVPSTPLPPREEGRVRTEDLVVMVKELERL